MPQRKILFLDRDGTLIQEPSDYQVDHLEKVAFLPMVIPSLLKLKEAGYHFVMVSNQDGLGTASFPEKNFKAPQELLLQVFSSQGIEFESIRICPHTSADNCDCRKPKVGLLMDYLTKQSIDRAASYVIGDRQTDMELAKNIGIQGIRIGQAPTETWPEIAELILSKARTAQVSRKTKETVITAEINLDNPDKIVINTGLGFLDHMVEQLAKHGGFSLILNVEGDLHIDEHHTVEDAAIVIGETLKKALGNKKGISRYGFLLPMDEASAQIALDLSGRAYFIFKGEFKREKVGELATELVPHFFRSLADSLQATLHIDVKGENEHHMIECIFKGVGRTLRQAIAITDSNLPSTKGLL